MYSLMRNDESRELIVQKYYQQIMNCWGMEQVKEMPAKDGVDIVIEATGAPPVLKDAMAAARTGGSLRLYCGRRPAAHG